MNFGNPNRPQAPRINITDKMLQLSSAVECPVCYSNIWLQSVSLRRVSAIAVPELPADVLLNTPRYICANCGEVIDGAGNHLPGEMKEVPDNTLND
ncbi:MAG: hypothetical protein WC343_08990 [Bacilli bacterium]|jgi:hypothetical protein